MTVPYVSRGADSYDGGDPYRNLDDEYDPAGGYDLPEHASGGYDVDWSPATVDVALGEAGGGGLSAGDVKGDG